MSKEDAEARIAQQASREDRIAIADKVIMLDKDAKGIIAEGDPKVLRDTSKDPRVHQFFNRIMSKDAA